MATGDDAAGFQPDFGVSAAGSEEQRQRYLSGHRRNPLTTMPLGARLLSASQLLWFSLLPPTGYGVLTTTGRKSGKPRRKCVRAVRHNDTVYLVSLRGPYSAWMRNIRAQSQVKLRLERRTFEGRARPLTDDAERTLARELYCRQLSGFERLEYRMHRRGKPTPERIGDLHEHWFDVGTPLAVDLCRTPQSG